MRRRSVLNKPKTHGAAGRRSPVVAEMKAAGELLHRAARLLSSADEPNLVRQYMRTGERFVNLLMEISGCSRPA
jgi:hypothetical protein